MKSLFLIFALACGITAAAQQNKRPYQVPEPDKRLEKEHVLPAYEASSTKGVLIMGEAEARAAVLRGPNAADTLRQFHSYIAKIASEYERLLLLTRVQSGALIRTLAAQSDELPTKYAVHFEIDRWFRRSVDAKQYEAWRKLPAYPEYRYSYLLRDDIKGK
jgi:hypothetical protein